MTYSAPAFPTNQGLHAVRMSAGEDITSPLGPLHASNWPWEIREDGWLLMERGTIYGVVRQIGVRFELMFATPEGHVSEPLIGYTPAEACADAIVRLQCHARAEGPAT